MKLSYHKIFERKYFLSYSTLYSSYTQLSIWQILRPQLVVVMTAYYRIALLYNICGNIVSQCQTRKKAQPLALMLNIG